MPLLLLFILVPAIELWLLIAVGNAIGLGNTLLLILATGVIGASLARRQGLAVLASVQSELDAGRAPASKLLEGALILVAGAMLLAPGFLTDAFGVLLLVPFTRRLFLGVAGKVFVAAAARGATRMTFTSVHFGNRPPGRPEGGAPFGPGGVRGPGGAPIKDAEFEVREDRERRELE